MDISMYGDFGKILTFRVITAKSIEKSIGNL